MLRILELILEGFAPILAGTGKERICIDLRDVDSRFIVFIGKIGSGKTYILSHLQPFATVGSLDVRNSDDPIIEGRDGYKQITYDKDGTIYDIRHYYTWTGSTHSKKSYITKDDVELNPNGNMSSFNDIIALEFGIDQSFLRLVRIGPNVTNFINMKATERKAFIASLLKDTEVYLSLYKYWSADLRTINTKVSILMNKLNTYGPNSFDDLKIELKRLEEKRQGIQHTLDEIKQARFDARADGNVCLNGMTPKEFIQHKKTVDDELLTVTVEIDDVRSYLDEYKDYPDMVTVSKEIGKYDSMVAADDETMHTLSVEYEELSKDLNILMDRKAVAGDADHMKTLQESYDSLLEKANQYSKQLRGFKCEYSSAYLTSLLDELNTISMLIAEINQYDTKMVDRLYHADSSIIQYSKSSIEKITYRKLKIQKMMNNIRFSDTYVATRPLYFPPFCPTKSCPYYDTHPMTLAESMKGKDAATEQLETYQNELQELDIELYKYSEYPVLYSKIASLKGYWNKIRPVLENIKALRCDALIKVLTLSQYSVWYDYDRIIDTIDLVEKRDKYVELTEQIKTIKAELNTLELSQDTSMDKEIDRIRQRKEQLASQLEEAESKKSDHQQKLTSYNEMYVKLSQKSDYEMQLSIATTRREELAKESDQMEQASLRLNDLTSLITKLDRDIVETEGNLKTISEKIDGIKTRINDISYTAKELDELLLEQKWMTYMVDAVGPKKGIPLKMVKVFFDSCRDTINEMLYMVSEEEFEIVDFNIQEKEFTIPYMVNGVMTDDISKASQGQTSLSSSALSFALMKELGLRSKDGRSYYPIPLLDEPDAALHKSDKPKLLSILTKYLDDIGSEQCFVITHDDDLFDGHDVQVIMTTDESVNQERYSNAIHV